MVRRAECTGTIDVLTSAGSLTLEPSAGVVAAVILAGVARLADGRILGPWTALVLGSGPLELDAAPAVLAVAAVRARG